VTGVRDLIRDPRVAAVVAASALLFVGYRVHQGTAQETAQERAGSESAPLPAGSTAAPDTTKNVGSAAGEIPGGAPLVDGFMRLPGSAASRGKDAAGARREAPWSWDRNPFLPAEKKDLSPGQLFPGLHGSSSGEAKGAWRLDPQGAFRGTVVSRGQGVAIFGDRIVSEGGTVGEWTVDRVEPYRVVVRRGTESRTLEMFRLSPPGR